MTQTSRRFLTPVFLAAALLLVSPALAGLVLSGVTFTPDAPPEAGAQHQAAATYVIIPSGSATFARGHSLQLQTDLIGARWAIQVTLDGRDAARQTASGSAAFVNGEVLSYPTTRDVGLVVTVDGTVPPGAGGSLSVIRVEELDNNGNVVPASVLGVSLPRAGQATPSSTTAAPTLTPPLATTSPARSPGLAAPSAVAGLLVTAAVLGWFSRPR
jgi:hypothetical protein